jgi:hypothetical protein
MTKKEAEYINRLQDRRLILEARLDRTPGGASFRPDIQKELNALKWAINFIDDRMAAPDAERVGE